MGEESTLNCSSEDVVVVTGMGVYSPIGNTLETFWDALASGRDGFREVTQFDTSMFSTHIAGTVEGTWRSMPEMSSWKEEDDCVGYGLYAALQARQHARIVEGAIPRHRQALVVGTSMGSHQTKDRARQIFDEDTEQSVQWFDEGRFGVETAHIAKGLGVEGVCLTLSTACTSSAHAIGVGRMLLQMDVADVVYVVGVDPIAREAFAGFFTLGVMSPQPCAPFGAPEGMSMGEGAGAIVLERSTHAARRDVRCVTALRGIGLSCDGFHPTTPEPSGKGIARAIESALSDGGLLPEDIGYYNAHGTGTLANDAAEWKGVQRVFGPHAASLPVSSTKSYLGHTQGAAGILELIATLLALQHQVVLPTLHLQQPRKHIPDDPVAETQPRAHSYENAVCHSSAFGGLNATVVVGQKGEQTTSHKQEDVEVLGVGCIGAHGFGSVTEALQDGAMYLTDAGETRLFDKHKGPAGFVSCDVPRSFVKRVDLNSMDPISRYLTVAVASTLKDAQVRLRGDRRERVGMFVGTSRNPAESSKKFFDTAIQRGWDRAPSHDFARNVLNAPAGVASLAYGLRGAAMTFAGRHSGFFSAICAYHWLRSREDTDMLLAGGCDELGEDELVAYAQHCRPGSQMQDPGSWTLGEGGAPHPLGEGAALVLLGKAETVEAKQSDVRISIVGTALAGQGRLLDVIRTLSYEKSTMPWDAIFVAESRKDGSSKRLREAMMTSFGAEASSVPVWDPVSRLGFAAATSSSLALVAAVESMRTTQHDLLWGGAKNGVPPKSVCVFVDDMYHGCGAIWLRVKESQ